MSKYDLEERTFRFAKNVTDAKQLVRSSGSIGANYIEANEALSMKDFIMRIKISRKEAKETSYWLKLLDTYEEIDLEAERDDLLDESIQLLKILSAILVKST